MRIVEALWERRNLGREVLEIEFEANDKEWDPGALKRAVSADYVLAKVPAGNVRLVHALEDDGYRFLEAQITIQIDLSQPLKPPASADAICASVASRAITQPAALDELLFAMDTGMFNTDRVSLDPVLGPGPALTRYQNWIRDEFSNVENVLQGLYLGQKPVGFFLLRKLSAEHYFASLAGVFTLYRGTGLGVAAMWKPIEWALANGARRLTTRNSANNPASLKIHLAVGYQIQRVHYLLRKANGARV
jgi:GNAT superfamily N-acetyltransferase